MDIEIYLWLTVFAVYFVLTPALVFLQHERLHRLRWRRRERVLKRQGAPGGSFRGDGPAGRIDGFIVEHRGAPGSVKVVVVASLVLGHMFIPGLFAGLCGLPIYGLGLLSIPGLVLAARIYNNAFGLLRCDREAARAARELQRFAYTLNVVVLLLMGLVATVWLHPLLVFTSVYAVISMIHGYGLGVAADAIDAARDGAIPERVSGVSAGARV